MRAKRASEKVGYNFNDVTISTFGISECMTILTEYNFDQWFEDRSAKRAYNFDEIQFQLNRST